MRRGGEGIRRNCGWEKNYTECWRNVDEEIKV
jgi:hypothetical protein